jgi:hypothetical protein
VWNEAEEGGSGWEGLEACDRQWWPVGKAGAVLTQPCATAGLFTSADRNSAFRASWTYPPHEDTSI